MIFLPFWSARLITLVLALATASGLAQQPVNTAVKSRPPAASSGSINRPAAAGGSNHENTVINRDDMIMVRVFQEDDLTTTARVAADGTVVMPLIGSVRVAGKTLSQASAVIRSALLQGYLVNPQVTISVEDFAKRRFTILGEVARPGAYDFPDQGTLDLLTAVGLAGGYSRLANESKITIKRRMSDGDKVFKVNGKRLAGNDTEPFYILPGDMITIGQSIF